MRNQSRAGPSGRCCYYDNLKAILVLAVACAHFLDIGFGASFAGKIIHVILHLIMMPVFVWVSGVFVSSRPDNGRKAVHALLVPYFLFYGLTWLFNLLILGRCTPFNPFVPLFGLWYLLALAFWKGSYNLVASLRYPFVFVLTASLFGACLSTTSTYMSMGRILAYWPFFWLGTKTGRSWQPASLSLKMRILLALSAGILLVSFAIFFLQSGLPNGLLLGSKNYQAMGLDSNAHAVLIRLLLYSFAAFCCYLLLHLVPKKETPFTGYGQNTLAIYLLHLYVVQFCTEYGYLDGQGWKTFFLALAAGAGCFFVFGQPVFSRWIHRTVDLVNRFLFTQASSLCPCPLSKKKT